MKFWYAAWEPFWLRALLLPLTFASWCFAAAAALRRWAYRSGVLRTRRVQARVISVGNLVAGGAGKTPVVVHLAQALAARGRKVCVLSRGYGRRTRGARRVTAGVRPEEVGDEPLLVARRCPEAVVLVGEDRAALAETAVREHGAQEIILDDGFQHLRLHRDLDVVVVDGLGNGRLLPRGPLRETPYALHRAHLLWGSGGAVESRLVATDAEPVRGRKVLAVAGIARPERFRALLVDCGARVEGDLWFPDHHAFPAASLARIAETARARGCEAVAVTEKDAVKLPAQIDGIPVLAVPVRLELIRGEDVLQRALDGAPPAPRPPVPRARFLEALALFLTDLVWLAGIRRRIMLDNLARAFPELDEPSRRALARKNLQHLGRALAEAVAARREGLDALVDGEDALARGTALRAGGGLVVAVAHFGNFELFGHWAGQKLGLAVIARALRGRANELLKRARREAGMRELPPQGSVYDALRVLREGGVLGVAVDQNMLPKNGIFVDFFGHAASTTPAAALLARSARVPLVAAFLVRGLDGRHRVHLEGPFDSKDTRACTQALTACVEKYVRAHPEQWFWVHRRWKTRPPTAPHSGDSP